LSAKRKLGMIKKTEVGMKKWNLDSEIVDGFGGIMSHFGR